MDVTIVISGASTAVNIVSQAVSVNSLRPVDTTPHLISCQVTSVPSLVVYQYIESFIMTVIRYLASQL